MHLEDFADNLRLRSEDRDPLLDKLDFAAAKLPSSSRRNSQRLAYRVESIPVTITHPGGSVARCLVKARNLSAGGMSFLYGGFLHHGTECRIILKTLDASSVVVDATVRSCRLVQHHIHEVGVQFREKLDPTLFCGPTAKVTSSDGAPAGKSRLLQGTVLLTALHDVEERGLSQRLRGTGLTVLTAPSVGAALDLLRRLTFDVLICSDSIRTDPAGDMLKSLRAAGHSGLLVVLTESASQDLVDVMEGNALCMCFARPVEISQLTRAIAETMSPSEPRPILCDLNDETSPVGSFVDSARTISRQLREATQARDVTGARRGCLQIRTTAGGYGFGAVAEVARQAEQLLIASPNAPMAFRTVEYLSDLLMRLQAPRRFAA